MRKRGFNWGGGKGIKRKGGAIAWGKEGGERPTSPSCRVRLGRGGLVLASLAVGGRACYIHSMR